MGSMLRGIFSVGFGYSMLRVTTPILFAALGAVVSERAGVVNIGLEGIMLISGVSGVLFSAWTGSAWLGLLGALLMSILFALFMGYFHIKLGTDIILAGIALNVIASGGTVFVLYVASGDRGISSSLASKVMPTISLPVISKIPVLGPIVSGHNVLTYFALLAVIAVWYFMYKTPVGLRLRAVGESPDSAASVGISVERMRFLALGISGLLAGFGGAHLSMGYVSWFSRDMTAGRGFIGFRRGAPDWDCHCFVVLWFCRCFEQLYAILKHSFRIRADDPLFSYSVWVRHFCPATDGEKSKGEKTS